MRHVQWRALALGRQERQAGHPDRRAQPSWCCRPQQATWTQRRRSGPALRRCSEQVPRRRCQAYSARRGLCLQTAVHRSQEAHTLVALSAEAEVSRLLGVQMLGDYPKTLDGVERRPFSWLSPASRSTAAASPAGMLPPPPRQLPALTPRRIPETAPPPTSAAGAAAERASTLEAPAKAPAGLARIRLGEHAVLWQRGNQTPAAHAATAADRSMPEPAVMPPPLVDYPDTALRGNSPADVPSYEQSAGPASEAPSAAQSADDGRSSSGGAPAWMVEHGSGEKADPSRRAAAEEDSRPSSSEYPITADADVDDVSDAELLQSPSPGAAPEPATEPPDAADSERDASEPNQSVTEAEERVFNAGEGGEAEMSGDAGLGAAAEQPSVSADDDVHGDPRQSRRKPSHKRSAPLVIKRGRGRPPKRCALPAKYAKIKISWVWPRIERLRTLPPVLPDHTVLLIAWPVLCLQAEGGSSRERQQRRRAQQCEAAPSEGRSPTRPCRRRPGCV